MAKKPSQPTKTSKTPKGSTSKIGKVGKAGRLGKPISKNKLKNTSKGARAEINKLNMDVLNVQALHSTLTQVGQAPKQVNALDAKSLRDGLKKDVEINKKNAQAEKDLTAQLELLTGMEL